MENAKPTRQGKSSQRMYRHVFLKISYAAPRFLSKNWKIEKSSYTLDGSVATNLKQVGADTVAAGVLKNYY